MDAKIVVEMSKWIMSELVRIFHGVDTAIATQAVETLTDRTTPTVWVIGASRRVLKPNLPMKDQTLLLLYSATEPVQETDLVAWVEHSNPSVYRRDILRRVHRERLIEYDETAGVVHISPTGTAYVEENLPLEM